MTARKISKVALLLASFGIASFASPEISLAAPEANRLAESTALAQSQTQAAPVAG